MTYKKEKLVAAALAWSYFHRNVVPCNNQERELFDACNEYVRGNNIANLFSKIDNLRSVRERNANRGNKELDDAVWSVITLADAVR